LPLARNSGQCSLHKNTEAANRLVMVARPFRLGSRRSAAEINAASRNMSDFK
jgi:hypothetical protein